MSKNDLPMESLTDEDLIAKIADGDNDAMAYVMQRYRGIIRAKIAALGWNRADADELVQDTFIRLWHYAPRLAVNNKGWKLWGLLPNFALIVCGRRLNYNGRRIQKRQGFTFSADALVENSQGKKHPAYTFVDREPLQDSSMFVESVLSLLPPDDRTIFELFLDDASVREITELTSAAETPQMGVKYRLGLIRGRLQNILRPPRHRTRAHHRLTAVDGYLKKLPQSVSADYGVPYSEKKF